MHMHLIAATATTWPDVGLALAFTFGPLLGFAALVWALSKL